MQDAPLQEAQRTMDSSKVCYSECSPMMHAKQDAPGGGSCGTVLCQAALLTALCWVVDGGQVHVRLALANARVLLDA